MATARVRVVRVPYRGGAQQLTDAPGAQFEMLSINAGPGLLEHVRTGRLRPLAVGVPRRLESLPQVPTLAELGFSRANLSSLFGVFAPGNLPVRLVDRINGEVNIALVPSAQNQQLKDLIVKVRPAIAAHPGHAKHLQPQPGR